MEIIKSIILNIGLLMVIAQLLARVPTVKQFVVRDKHTVKEQLLLIVLFSAISITSTYMGIEVNGAIANTRVIGVMAGGFIGGPVVGIGTAVIAGVHRYLIDINGFTAIACTVSTITEGGIAALFYQRVRRNKYREDDIFFLTFGAEILQMLIILLIARPYYDAVELVGLIALPMVVFNALGMVLFVGVFKYIFVEQAYEVGNKVGKILEITKKCLPIIRNGRYDEASSRQIAKIIHEFSKESTVIFTDKSQILSSKGHVFLRGVESLPAIVREVFAKKETRLAEEAPEMDPLHSILRSMVAIASPLMIRGEVFGCLIVLSPKYQFSYHSEFEFVEGLAQLLSTQYELAEMENQKELLRKVEYKVLQSQINPHFIFNSLNTISAFCREKPEKARELLIALATYFRNTIKTQDSCVSIYEEMDYVEAYLQLENARFEDRLTVDVQVEKELDCQVPCLILQPIVENAIIHGAMKRRHGLVSILVEKDGGEVAITVKDNGHGIPQEVLQGLEENTLGVVNIGLSNVHQRLCYLYGKDHGLKIQCTDSGTSVQIRIPLKKERQRIFDRIKVS
ncbi:histidine kinase [Proteiniclasticum sp. BAD-10]|uniref:Histidine kinase n=1 Tax=Proteiniclasticum sediminis TaxID=2804028 RepID=A0A941HRA3_9CLOT|nr:LytS/YhcK type 5TM receptor domain-containing protein [Proteiniclasticum sediminis]MBR0576388.1 histidine kinase [Proteiniclasticum sediminis]